MARGKLRGRIKVRCEARLCAQVERLAARFDQSSQSDLVRGVVVAAKEDVLDRRVDRLLLIRDLLQKRYQKRV